jgi:hypothetical protein
LADELCDPSHVSAQTGTRNMSIIQKIMHKMMHCSHH